MNLVVACIRIIKESQPLHWVIENVKGAVPFFWPLLGNPTSILGSFYLWGSFPPIAHLNTRNGAKANLQKHNNHTYGRDRAAKRAMVPFILSDSLAIAIERQHQLLPLEAR
jgi:hypothetical protein